MVEISALPSDGSSITRADDGTLGGYEITANLCGGFIRTTRPEATRIGGWARRD